MYHDKMANMITSGPYHTIYNDPTDNLSPKITNVLLDINMANCNDEQTYQKLRPNQTQPPSRINDEQIYQKLRPNQTQPPSRINDEQTYQKLRPNQTQPPSRINDEQTYQKLRPNQTQPPSRIYGLPKIHKPENPQCLIVSCVNSFTYNSSKFLADILSPLTGLSEHTVECSMSFVCYICH